jgi:hypothetical protein
MFLQSLPTSFHVKNEPTPPIYSDHFLFSEKLQRPYECPEHPSGLGLLITGKGNCDFYVNGIKNPDFSEFKLRVNIKTTVENAYKAWATASGLESWFLRKAVFKNEKGDTLSGTQRDHR